MLRDRQGSVTRDRNIGLNFDGRSTALNFQTNAVVRNTYLLLSATLLFSLITGWFGMYAPIAQMGPISLLISMGLLMAVYYCKDSPAGIFLVFAFTGFTGFISGPFINYTLALPNGGQILGLSIGSTIAIFTGLSMYAITTRKNFDYMLGFLMALSLVVLVGAVANIFFQIQLLHLALSSLIVLSSSGFILYKTSQLINGGETNYVTATVSLYLDIYNLFISLVNIFTALSRRDD